MNKDYIDKESGKYIVKTSQDINLKQDKLISGTNIKTINRVPLLGNSDIPISNNDWEVVNTSDFIRNSKEYTVRSFDNKYYYCINCSVETQFRIYGFTIFVNLKFINEKVPTTHYIGTSIEGYSSIFEWDKNTNYGKITIEKAESVQYLNRIYIERKK